MLSKTTSDSLIKLSQLIRANIGEGGIGTEFSFKWGKIPDDIEFDRTNGDSISIGGDEYRQYIQCLELLANEKEIEHSSKREIEKELWHLVCEIFANADKLKDPKALRKVINSFQDQLRKPLEEYEIIIPIENLQLGKYVHEINGVKLFQILPEFAEKWGIIKENKTHELFYKDAIDKVVALLSEYAADPTKAIARARNRVNTVLDVLRVALLVDHEPRIVGWRIHDEEMLFKQSEQAAAKKVGLKNILFDWQRGFRPIQFKVDEVIARQMEASRQMIKDLLGSSGKKGHLENRLLRTLEWISNSVTRDELDDKVVDICTALETLLTTQDDLRKGECIALRTMLLCSKLGKSFFEPESVMNIYLKRSEIVHGSSRRVCTESDYRIGRTIALDTFCKSLSYIESRRIKKHKAFIDSLQDDKDLFKKTVGFWKPSEYYPDILKAAERILDGNQIC